ncbi:MAG TPA: tRNA (adenosine(37)-N6)-dimethylallyltransferase MiaA [Methylomirabilota bacterium]|nr:tRNA (adenosine(37)-N6)-dimethylallyltransferase MiaA [Methylomirabilota bacterium]
MKPKIIILLGPTAVGKSDVALELAVEVNAEIINADSQQVYRYMNIGTAKPSPAVRERVPHHLIDIVDPDEEFNVAVFRQMAQENIEAIRRRKKNVIVCGGTGLYLKALTRGLFSGPKEEPKIRRALEAEIESSGLISLYRRLERFDPKATSWIHPHDRQRIIRALEVYDLTGKPISLWQKEHAFSENAFDALKLGLNRDRAELYELINRRCESMIQEGFLEEVRGLAEKGYGLDLKPMQSVGYRHMGLVLNGAMSLDKASELMKRDTRRLAKRQLTWFRQDREIRWFHPDAERQGIREAVGVFLS